MEFSIPELIEAVAILVVAVFVSIVFMKLGRLIDKYTEKVEAERK